MLNAVRDEIEGLHEFFADWFGGRVEPDPDLFQQRFVVRFGSDCLLIQPGGVAVQASDFIEAVRNGFGASPDFRSAIREVVVRRELGHRFLLMTYEEWQRNAVNSRPPETARLASVLFERAPAGQPLRWHHIHETWLPAARTLPQDFGFLPCGGGRLAVELNGELLA